MRNLRIFLTVSAIVVPATLASGAYSAPATGFPPSMSLKDRIDIVNSAGYQITDDGRTVYIYCDDAKVPTTPGVMSLDVTGDGKADYVMLGQRNCPGQPATGVQTDIVSRRPDGVWQNILSVQGTLKPGEGATDGWRNLIVVKGTRTINYVHNPETEQYANIADLKAHKTLALASVPTRTAPGVLPTAGWTAPYSMANLTPGDLAAILIAAGYKHKAGKWTGCGGSSDVALFDEDQLSDTLPITDLNSDGQPEVMVYDASSECYGNTGMSFNIVTPVPGGWKLIFEGGEGMPLVQGTKNASGWRDVVAGGSGFCHELYRYNGKAYVGFKQFEETKGACSGR